MTSYKRIDGDYYIQTVDPPYQKVYIDTDTTVTGNLTVQGNLTYINVDELNITDPFIVLNASNTATYAANSGVLTHITSSNYAGIRYNDNAGQWEISSSTSASGETGTWGPLISGTNIAGGSNTDVQFNDGGSLGGNTSFQFDYSTGQVKIGNTIAFVNQGATPSPWPFTSVVYSDVPGSGGTGLYFVTGTANDEFISKSKAIVFSIIF